MKAASTASEAGPEFVEKYPRLLEMACGATTTEAADVVRRMLSMMLTQMAAVERGNCSEKAMDAASVVVGQVVADRYLPKNIGKDA
jgi:hypothetical protein